MGKVYNLTIDRGNTAAKVSLWGLGPSQADRSVWHRVYTHIDADDIADICRDHPVRTAIYASVSESPATLLDALHKACSDVMILTPGTPVPLTVCYRTPDTLGVDRLAAAVGARTLPQADGRPLLIADIGTAITNDHVTADGRNMGGNIAPGIFMRLQALNHYTARLPMVEPVADCPVWGDDTNSALVAGAVNGVVAELQYYRSRLPADALTVVTGGAADLVIGRLSSSHIYVENLVSLGLEDIINFNRPGQQL